MPHTSTEEQHDLANNLAAIAAGVLPPDLGFVLLIFPRGGTALGAYNANIERDEAVRKLRKAADRVEQHTGWANGSGLILP